MYMWYVLCISLYMCWLLFEWVGGSLMLRWSFDTLVSRYHFYGWYDFHEDICWFKMAWITSGIWNLQTVIPCQLMLVCCYKTSSTLIECDRYNSQLLWIIKTSTVVLISSQSSHAYVWVRQDMNTCVVFARCKYTWYCIYRFQWWSVFVICYINAYVCKKKCKVIMTVLYTRSHKHNLYSITIPMWDACFFCISVYKSQD